MKGTKGMCMENGLKNRNFFLIRPLRVLMQKLSTLGDPPVTFMKRKYFRLQRLLRNYGKVLELLADISEKQGGEFVLDKQYLVALTNTLFDLADSIVYDLNVLTKQHHISFYDPLERFKKEIKGIIVGAPLSWPREQVISLSGAKDFLPPPGEKESTALIPEKLHGSLCTRDPASPYSGFVLVHIFSNSGHGESYKVSRNPPFEIIRFPNHPLPQSAQAANQILPPEDLARLITLGLRIERYFKKAQEIEWALDAHGQFIITQVQRLTMPPITESKRKNLAKVLTQHRMIYEGVGKIICRGIDWGPVFLIRNQEDLRKIPERAVMVASDIFPEWQPIQALQNAAAILTETRKPVSSVTALARNFRIPFIAGLAEVTTRLFSGTVITVDADENVVYEGKIEELVDYYLVEGSGYEDEPEYQMFQTVQEKIAPLSIINNIQCESSADLQTLHDLIHLAYENALAFLTHDDSYRKAFARMSKQLEIKDSLIFQVIDLGDGLQSENKSDVLTDSKAVQSRPMVVLQKAFSEFSRIFEEFVVSKKIGHDSSPGTHTESWSLKGTNTAILSREWVYLLLKRESEIDMVDAYLCEEGELNHIFCRFFRVPEDDYFCFLARDVLHRLDFELVDTPKAIHAWTSRLSSSAIEKRLRIVAYLLVFARWVDRGIYGDLSPEEVTRHFWQGCNISNPV